MIFKDKSILKALWAGMFILCAVLGFVPEQEGANRWLLLVFGVLFFVPPALLVFHACRAGDRKALLLVRNLSLISLAATVALLVMNMLSLLLPEALGNVLYYILVVTSAPMVCCQYWVISLFLWAMLLWSSLFFLRKAPQ